jgi:hypothetical protein
MIGAVASSAVAAAVGVSHVGASYSAFTGSAGTKSCALPAGSAVGDLVVFHSAGNIPEPALDGTGWTVVNTGSFKIAYKTIDAGLLAAGQVTWTVGTNYENGYAALDVVRGVGSVETTSVSVVGSWSEIYTPASGAAITNGMYLALAGGTANHTWNPSDAPWTNRQLVLSDGGYRMVASATLPATVADAVCHWQFVAVSGSTSYSVYSTILRLLP